MKVRAWAALTPSAALEPFDYELGEVGDQDVVVEVCRCGICHSDLHMVDNDWRMSTYPLVPGHEVVGRVVDRGRGVVHLRPGDRVGVGWQAGACMTCKDCLRGDENLCDDHRGLIVGGHGGFASALRVDSRFAFPIPAGIADDAAGPLLCGGVTVYSALRSAGMTSGQRVGVIGVGGLGHLAVQFASRLGNHVTVFTTSDDKAEFAARLGAHEAVVVKPGEAPPKPANRLDLLLNTVPVQLDWGAYLRWLGSDGTLVLVAGPGEPLPISFFDLLGKRRRVMGSPIGGRAAMTEMLTLADRHGIAPLVEVSSLQEVNAALDRLRANAVRYRAVLRV